MSEVPPVPPPSSKKGGWKDFVAGNFAGMSQVIVGQPLDTIKVRLQVESRFKGPMDCFIQTVKHEGFFALYKGCQNRMASPLVGIGAVNALLFAAYSRLKSIQTTSLNEQLALYKIAIAGAGAGAINSVLSSPVELLKIKMQAQYGATAGSSGLIYKGPIDCAKHLISEFGIRNGLFRGFWATVTREIPAYAGFYSGFEFAKRKLTSEGSSPDSLPPSKLMLAGSFGGFSYWICCYPFDVVKSKVQNHKNPPKGILYVFTTINSIYKNEGARAFTRGISPTILRSLPAAGSTFTVYELTMRILEKV